MTSNPERSPRASSRSESGSAERLDTFPRLILHHARVRPDRPAIREKDLGIWQTWTWKEVGEEVRALACGLAARGLARGAR
ncbi:MAG TPA: long-chain fatty acid--CoA ligase, partial [Thermoanaerobaculia bacterium]|nr:long-chain fatty acid--CoA ligase [Thermoanaerobaculia bacterium]